MKALDRIPVTKIERAGKLVKTGVKVGGNYVKHYGKKLVNPNLDRESLNEDNARDIYDGLKELKGSALKVAQMLSMEKNLLPRAYVDRFSLAQFNVPPLSAPLVRKTFRKFHGEGPESLFDEFESESTHAASIGQVHRAWRDGKALAVKIQYPGVADSIHSDLALVKPIALRMFNLQAKDTEKYFKEVADKLQEETDYTLELSQSVEITEACAHLDGMRFPSYYPELSSERILTMDWIEGLHLSEACKEGLSTDVGNKLGQALWDFYMFQIHGLKKVHADPHPGNFLVDSENNLVAIDFGCIKEIPEEFYVPYFELATSQNFDDNGFVRKKLEELEILTPEDSPEEGRFFMDLFRDMLELFTRPFKSQRFDFANAEFWQAIADLSQRYAKDPQVRKMDAGRGSRHFLYMNRTFFGLYNLMHDLQAEVEIEGFRKYL